MTNSTNQELSRRNFILAGLASTAGIALVGCEATQQLVYPTATPQREAGQDEAGQDEAVQLAPTPHCDDDDETPSQPAGPFYAPNTPERYSLLEEGLPGTKFMVTGKVLGFSTK